jgi:hypothetical protein
MRKGPGSVYDKWITPFGIIELFFAKMILPP